MKKIICSIFISLLLLLNSNISFSFENKKTRVNYVKQTILSKKSLEKNYKGRKYINIINKFIEKNENNKNVLIQVLNKITPLLKNGKIKNQDTLNIIKYLDGKINIAMLNLIKKIEEEINIISTYKGNYDKLLIIVYDDKKCTNCSTDAILEQLKLLPSIKSATIERKDFSDKGVKEYLEENEVKALPLISFSTNNFDVSKDPNQIGPDGKPTPKVNAFLKTMKTGEFILEVGAQFNPFVERSEKGFIILEQSKLKTIKNNSYIKGNKKAKITWLEFSDLECPYCAKLHNSGIQEELFKKYGDDLNQVFNHFPLSFHNNAQKGAEIIECLGEQKGSEAFYSLVKTAYSEKNSNKDFLITEAVKLGANKKELNQCIDTGKYIKKIKDVSSIGVDIFGITGIPGNVLINNKTGEYKIIEGNYPTSSFEKVIDKLLK